MRATSGTWLHAQLTLLVAACFSAGCGATTSNPGVGTAGTGPVAGGSGGVAQGGQGAQAGSVAQGGQGAQGGEGGMGAQGGEVAEGGATLGGAPGLLCPTGSAKLTDGWHTDPELDYVAQVWNSQEAPMIQEESGERCASAAVKADCEAAFAALEPGAWWDRGAPLLFQEYFAYTRGDDVGTVGSDDELRQMLGDIDTPNEAVVWLYVHQRPVQCDELSTLPDGYLAHSQQLLNDCPITYQPVDVHVAPDGTLTEKVIGERVVGGACAGRRPDGLQVAGGERGDSQLGECFAHMVELEMASIAAFETLERQLAAYGAPEALRRRCRAARVDEIEHARSVAHLARRFGARPKPVRVVPQGLPTLRELALENAREGSVRELYGAVVATWQSQHAQDAQVRDVFSRIARDESEHAALSLDLAAWLEPQLSVADRAEVEAERQRAVAQLRDELLVAPDAHTQAIAGLPSAAHAAALLTALWGTGSEAQQLFS